MVPLFCTLSGKALPNDSQTVAIKVKVCEVSYPRYRPASLDLHESGTIGQALKRHQQLQIFNIQWMEYRQQFRVTYVYVRDPDVLDGIWMKQNVVCVTPCFVQQLSDLAKS